MTMSVFWTLLAICVILKQVSSGCVSREEFSETINELKTLKEELASLKENAPKNNVNLNIAESENRKRFVADPTSENVAFSALLNKPDLTGLGAGQTLMFDTVVSNLGNAFDQRLSVFTAKTTGWYVFSLTIMTSPSTINQFHVVNNGVEIFHVFSHGNEFNSASKTMVTHLTAGDEVWVKRTTAGYSTSIHGAGHTSFTGWLQYSDEV